MTIKEELNTLKTTDVYSLLLFILFRIKDIPEYSTLSELVYILDKDNFLKLCEYFGGLTIHIPTTEELEDILDAMLMYQYVAIEGRDYIEVRDTVLGIASSKRKTLKSNYLKIQEIMEGTSYSV